jgi:hypothetical protein
MKSREHELTAKISMLLSVTRQLAWWNRDVVARLLRRIVLWLGREGAHLLVGVGTAIN